MVFHKNMSKVRALIVIFIFVIIVTLTFETNYRHAGSLPSHVDINACYFHCTHITLTPTGLLFWTWRFFACSKTSDGHKYKLEINMQFFPPFHISTTTALSNLFISSVTHGQNSFCGRAKFAGAQLPCSLPLTIFLSFYL